MVAQPFGKSGVYCEVCEVSCSSKDAYEAHIRGIKHQKVHMHMLYSSYAGTDLHLFSLQPDTSLRCQTMGLIVHPALCLFMPQQLTSEGWLG